MPTVIIIIIYHTTRLLNELTFIAIGQIKNDNAEKITIYIWIIRPTTLLNCHYVSSFSFEDFTNDKYMFVTLFSVHHWYQYNILNFDKHLCYCIFVYMVKYQIFQSENIKSSLNSATLWLCFYSSSLSLFLISHRHAFLNLLQICPFLQLAGPDVELAGFKTFDLEQKYLSSGLQHFISEPGASGLEG